MTSPARILVALLVLAAVGLTSSPVAAGSLAVSPLKIELGERERTAALTLRNGSPQSVVVQAQAYLWEQQGGEDRLSETQDLIVSPVVFTLAGEGSQLLRVALRRPVDPSSELSYRLVLQEVPQRSSPQSTGLSMALRLSLPVFVRADAVTSPSVNWSAIVDPDGNLVVTARNEGTAHLRLLGFEVAAEGNPAHVLRQPVASYVLPGQSRSWALQPETDPANGPQIADERTLRLKALTDDGDIEAELALAGR
jgi:fimbrial chaperone protein